MKQELTKMKSVIVLITLLLALPQRAWAEWDSTPKDNDGGDVSESLMKKVVDGESITLVTALGNISTYFFNYNATESATYTSSNEDVARISSGAPLVNIAGAGTATITATVGDATYSYTLIVNNLAFSSTSIEAVLNEPLALPDKVVVTPTSSSTAPITFSATGAASVGTIDNEALTFTGTKLGEWANALSVNFKNEGNYIPRTSAPTCSLKVVPPAPTITPATSGVYNYDDGTKATVSMPDAITSDALGTYSAKIKYRFEGDDTPSSDYDYDEVEESGIDIESSCTLKVWIEIIDEQNNNTLIVKSVEASADFTIRLNPGLYFEFEEEPESSPIQIQMGKTLTAPAVKSESDETWTPTVTWSSSNTAIATVNETTGVVTPVSASDETVTITASFAGNETYAPSEVGYDIKVIKGTDYFSIVETNEEGTTTNYSDVTIEAIYGQDIDLTKAVNLSYPEGLTLTWACTNNNRLDNVNDPQVGTVSTTGTFTPTGFGQAQVTVSTVANSNYDSDNVNIFIKVYPPAPTITANKEEGLYYPNDVTLNVSAATVLPTDVNGLETVIEDNEYNQTVPYTITSVGDHAITAYSQVSRSATGQSFTHKSDVTSKDYLICNKPVISNEAFDTGLTISISCDDLNTEAGYSLMYYEGNDKAKAQTYSEAIEITESKTINAFVRYTNEDTGITYDSEPVAKTFNAPEMSFAAETAEVTFGSTLNSPALTKPEGVSVTYSSSNEAYATVNATTGVVTPIKVGTVNIIATSAPTGEYVSGSVSYALTINPKSIAGATVTVDATQSYTYSGEAIQPSFTVKDGETLLVSGTDYTFAYDNNVNAGEETAKVIVTGKGNYDTQTTAEGTFSIGKATPVVTAPTAKTLTYNGNAQELVEAGSTTGGTLQYKLGSDGQYGTEIPTATDAADAEHAYAVYYKVVGDDNYNDVAEAGPVNITIAKADITPVITISGWTYGEDSNAPKVTEESNPGNGTPTYQYKERGASDDNYSETVPGNAGNYTVRATIPETTNYNGGTGTTDFTIEQATIDAVTLVEDVLVYQPGIEQTGIEQTVEVASVKAGSLDVNSAYYEVSGNKATDAGTYTVTVTAKVMEGNNFKGSATANYKINHRTAENITFDEGNGQIFCTYYDATESFLLPEGMTAYIITGIGDSEVNVEQVSYIKAGVPTLIKKAEATEIEETPDDGFEANLLMYANEDVTITGEQYVLYRNEFVKATGSVPSGKCYIEINDISGAPGARSFTIGGSDDGSTAIEGIVQDTDNSDQWYDLQGHRIKKPNKAGLYIVNGKKVVINNK